MNEKQRLLHHFRMQVAQARQILRDQSEEMTEEEVDKLLDLISKLTILIRELEK